MWWRLGTPLCPVTPLRPARPGPGTLPKCWMDPLGLGRHPQVTCHLPGGSSLGPCWQPFTSLPCPLEMLFPPGVGLGPPSLPRLGSPREDVTCANHPAFLLPLCREASHFSLRVLALRPSFRRPAQGGPGREVDSPARQMAVLTCPLLPATPPPPRLGVEPCPALPLVRPAATS